MKKTLAWIALSFALLAPAVQAQYVPYHPRVNQVNGRVGNQRARIQQGVNNGTLTRGQAAQLHGERQAIKTEEHVMRADDGGHLTRGDQAVLNQQLNARSRQIYNEKHY